MVALGSPYTCIVVTARP